MGALHRTFSPVAGSIIALGYVHRYHLTPGTEFTLKQSEAELGRAELVELPFIKK